MAREGRGEGTVGRRPRWVAAAAAAIVPAPRVSVWASALGRGLGRRSRAPGRLEPQLRVPGPPLPSPPPAARSRAGPGPCVARGSASRRSSEAAARGNTETARNPFQAYRARGGHTGPRRGRAFFSVLDHPDGALRAPPRLA